MSTPSTRADVVYRCLRADILNGRLEPGSRLRVEALSEAYGVSSGVLREALPRLVGQGLAVRAPQQGFRVISVTVEDLLHLTEARVAIEVLVFRMSIEHGSTDWEASVVANHHTLTRTPEYDDAGDISDEWAAAHARFHGSLLDGYPNLRLRAIADSLRESAEVYREWSNKPGEAHHRDVAAEHKAICDYALARDVEAAGEALRSHIELTTKLLLDGRDENLGASEG